MLLCLTFPRNMFVARDFTLEPSDYGLASVPLDLLVKVATIGIVCGGSRSVGGFCWFWYRHIRLIHSVLQDLIIAIISNRVGF